MNTIVGQKIKGLRKQKGLSQEQVAEHLHLSQSAYARIESGESASWAAHIESICNLFDIRPDELLKTDTLILNQNTTGDNAHNAYIINQLSEKLIDQYEARLTEKDIIIHELKERIKQLEND